MSTVETDLATHALTRDIVRYVDSEDAAARERIMARMIDTVMDLDGCDQETAVRKIVDLIEKTPSSWEL